MKSKELSSTGKLVYEMGRSHDSNHQQVLSCLLMSSPQAALQHLINAGQVSEGAELTAKDIEILRQASFFEPSAFSPRENNISHFVSS
jgi:hypothetical protein